MPAVTAVDTPPPLVAQQLAALRAALDNEPNLPARDAAHLLLGTWNVRAFGGLTAKWDSTSGDSPKRNLTDVSCLAEIVRRFDVCAIQETRSDLTAMLTLLRRLGPSWGVILTDAGLGDAANDERLAYVFDRNRVRPSGLAGELVIDAATFGTLAVPLRAQFARPPFMVSFEAGAASAPVWFTLISLHVDYGKAPTERTPEIQTFATWLRQQARDREDFNSNLIALGDFNIDRWNDPNGRAFASAGLTPPAELLDQPRSIFDTPTEVHFYDQIAWFTAGTQEQLTLRYTKRAGRIEWTKLILTGLGNVAKSWRISDHYPLFAHFALT
jgi:endonuclease/exonuclease/phosphatase family metal-dependent hydrolase